MSQSFTDTRQSKETIMNYQDIEDWNLAGKDFIVLDRRQEARIHLNWFRPKILLEQLLRKQEKGDFIYQGDKESSVADIVLQRFIRKANRP